MCQAQYQSKLREHHLTQIRALDTKMDDVSCRQRVQLSSLMSACNADSSLDPPAFQIAYDVDRMLYNDGKFTYLPGVPPIVCAIVFTLNGIRPLRSGETVSSQRLGEFTPLSDLIATYKFSSIPYEQQVILFQLGIDAMECLKSQPSHPESLEMIRSLNRLLK
jgi:hypothetical protein